MLAFGGIHPDPISAGRVVERGRNIAPCLPAVRGERDVVEHVGVVAAVDDRRDALPVAAVVAVVAEEPPVVEIEQPPTTAETE
jgi:hypothetical protein